MHELAITQSMFNLVIDEANKAKASKVKKVNLVIGEMTGVVNDSVQFYFELISKGSIAEGAVLSFKREPIQVKCRNCGETFIPEEFDWSCPRCHNSNVDLKTGNELFVDSIEVEDGSQGP